MEVWPKGHCPRCGMEKMDADNGYCLECNRSSVRKLTYAMREVRKAVDFGLLPNLKESYVPCIDCGKRATLYEHRDYDSPLKVDPCCRGCNSSRGIGENRFCSEIPGTFPDTDIYKYRGVVVNLSRRHPERCISMYLRETPKYYISYYDTNFRKKDGMSTNNEGYCLDLSSIKANA